MATDGTVGVTTPVLAAIIYVACGSQTGEEAGALIVIPTHGWEVVNVLTSLLVTTLVPLRGTLGLSGLNPFISKSATVAKVWVEKMRGVSSPLLSSHS